MLSTHQRFHLRACRRIALEQNQRLFKDANAISRAAYELLDSPQLNADSFIDYQTLKKKAEAKFRDAIEHLQLVNREFAEPPTLPEVADHVRHNPTKPYHHDTSIADPREWREANRHSSS